MVTSTHETSHRIFQDHPEVLTPAFEALGLPPPAKAIIEALTPDATEIKPLERRVDTVLKVEPSEGDGFLIAIEAQTTRSRDEGASWSYYVAHLHAKFRLPVLLVVVCRNRPTASWAAGPFECRVGTWRTQSTRPFVLGPDNVAEITDESIVAREPAMATLSAIVHSESENAPAILDMLARGMRSFDKATAKYWCEWLEVGLEDTPVRETWRELEKMVATYFPGRGTLFEETYLEGKAEGKAEGKVEGKAEGKAESILSVLEKRGIDISEATRSRITSCSDLDTLTLWFDRSLTATSAENLFATGPVAPA
ncbi:hypothetical protein GCM10010313_49330 [Streptomyces violarus]|uniref:Uncharacterized protein n=1 Tax=Streptomyces violarus TaxID=67380 RepID=A0A7W4ZSN7_9ACTN|nr:MULTISPECIES: hypothetical protein [Streptomyces]MBB3077921.1 hypothetical protein [Streptomyces violarus]WRT99907.1 hypothetical protein VJ737_20375 [Streptomyces sp. CGMCC 4.1772]GHD18857.1 hypothetical protein GCM10010313_49330 [Streptomyces violarus]